MEPSAADDDTDDAEMLSSHLQTPTDVLPSPAAQHQYNCQADVDSSSVPVWSECLPIPVSPLLQPAHVDMHAAADFLTNFRQGKKSALHTNVQTRLYNFLERPTGWKCFLYHFSV